jgi:hypothetical protein
MKMYKYLSECRDYDMLKNRYSSEILSEIEESLVWWEESEEAQNYNEGTSPYEGYEDKVIPEVLRWYGGLIDTDELCEFIDDCISIGACI